MHTGILEPRKNVDALVRAFAQLAPDLRAAHDLVLVGAASPDQIQHVKALARTAGLDETALVFPGFVPDEDLVALYGLTRVAVMPSLSEGFGLPILEAMRCGAPVLAANRTSLPEVVGRQAYLFDPQRPADLTVKLMHMLTDIGFREAAVAWAAEQEKRFAWKNTATRAHEAMMATVARGCQQPVQQSSRGYVLAPPATLPGTQSTRVIDVIAALGRPTAVIAAQQSRVEWPAALADCPIIAPDTIRISGDQPVLIMADTHGLDSTQRIVLERTPAIVLAVEDGALSDPSAEMLYRFCGYPALAEGASPILLNALLAAQPNVLDVVSDHAGDLHSQIERVYANHPLALAPQLLTHIDGLSQADTLAAAAAIAQNQAPTIAPRLLVDISTLVHVDAHTGIQRVVRSVLKNLLTERRDRRIEPIFRDGDIYRYARRFTCKFLNIAPLAMTDAVVAFHPTDIFFGLDLDGDITDGAAHLLEHESRCGMQLVFLVHDLIPVLHPEWFEQRTSRVLTKWIGILAAIADRLIAVSRATADDIHRYVGSIAPARVRALEIAWSHNGCDLAGSVPTIGITADQREALRTLEDRTIFLAVGTIEPRKGIGHLLDAADFVWRDCDVTFVLVGRRGWNVDDLITRISHHPELGQRLFWFDSISDEGLERLYQMATAVVLPSEAEGFGLPLVEAAAHGKPIIARDIAVFREIGAEGAFYFAGSADELATALRDWLKLWDASCAPSSAAVERVTWRESTQHLYDAIHGGIPYRSWQRDENR
jgi:glycosyltransferase involved in cell wall biosynthesis